MEVEDTGTGISPAELPHIFERFHRVEGARSRTIEGTGIGLALVQELVKLHGGRIDARSALGQGTVFTVALPLGSAHLPAAQIREADGNTRSREPAEYFIQEAMRWIAPVAGTRDEMQAEVPTPRTGERILLADDNPDMRDYVMRLLSDRYQVATAANGEEALAAALADPPDLILSDIMMPGIGGFGLLAELRGHAETSTIPVILLSARAGEESRVEGLTAGADDYLIKPFTARELLARVSAHLAMKKRREEAEMAVRESQNTLQSFYDSSTFIMGIAEIDEAEIIDVHCNPATERFLGRDGQTIRGRAHTELGIALEINNFWLEQYRSSQAQGSAVRFEFEWPFQSGNRCLNAVVNYLGSGPAGRPRFSFIAEDVTEKRRAADLLRRSNEELRRANADLEQFAYSASHDLQEPLRQVAVYSQLLEKRYSNELPPKAIEYLGWCVEGAHRMEMLVQDLLAYSQAGRTAVDSEHAVDLNEVLENVRKNLATAIAESAATIEIASLPQLYIHPAALKHVFQNLVSNALKYRSEEPPHIIISAASDGHWWRFAVEDNGIGIPEEFRTQIFGIFKRLHNRRDYPGTGIGLAICQRIVERYGGRIWIVNQQTARFPYFSSLCRKTRLHELCFDRFNPAGACAACGR